MSMFERYLSEEFDDKNKKKFTIIDNKYFCYSWADVKTMKKKIIDMPNKVFINGEDK